MYKYLLLFLALTNSVSANEDTKSPEEIEDFSLKFSVISRTHELEFLDRSLENYITFRPNTPYVFQAELFYKYHVLKLETDNISDIGINKRKGNSSYNDIEYTFFHKNAEFRGYYGVYSGFYVSGQRDSAGNYFDFKDMNTKRYGFEYKTYKTEPRMISVNNKFSANYSKLPKHFGTIVYGILFDVSSVNNMPSDPAILSQIQNSEFLFFNDIELVTLSPFAGGIGRFAINNYFIEGGLNIGFGLQSQKFTLDSVNKSEIDYSLVGSAFVTLGTTINNNGIFGIRFAVESVEPSVEKNEFSIATVDASVFFQLRF